ncbi:hypothetical protein PAXRUDRAFT_164226, partial [Paxillus rubicundulus Ve08.2h10]
GITFDPMDCHIMCFPHILNICSGHVTGEYTHANFASIGEAWVNALNNVIIDKDAYMEALQHDPIALGWDIVRAVHSSSLRCEGFHNILSTGNQMNWFTDEEGRPTQLPILELLHDVKSHWDSIH